MDIQQVTVTVTDALAAYARHGTGGGSLNPETPEEPRKLPDEVCGGELKTQLKLN